LPETLIYQRQHSKTYDTLANAFYVVNLSVELKSKHAMKKSQLSGIQKLRLGLYALIPLAIVGFLLLFYQRVLTIQAPNAQDQATIPIGGPIALIDQNGMPFGEAQLQGRYRLIYFGFSFCPDICPTELTNMQNGLQRFEAMDAARARKVQPIFISVDPERDTPAALKDYASNFHPRLVALTGTPAQIASTTKAYRIYAQKRIEGGDSQNYLVDHSSVMFLMAPDGRYLTNFGYGTPPDTIAKTLSELVL
jgi:protein SCO1